VNKITKIVLVVGVVVLAVVGGYTVYNKQGGSGEQGIIIGSVLPLTGDLAAYGEGSRNAAIMAIEDAGMKERVRFIVEDDKGCDPVLGVGAVQKLITIDKVSAIYGPLCSSEALSVLPITEAAGIPVVLSGASSKTLTGAGNYVFRTIASDSVRAYAVANYAYVKGFRKAAFVFDNSQDAIIQGKNDAQETFVGAGGESVSEESFGGKDVDFKAQLSKIKSSGADVVFVGAFPKTLALIIKQAREMKMSTQFISFDASVDVKEFFVIGGSNVEGVIAPAMVKPNTEEAKSFETRYKARFGVDATIYAAEGYDAMALLLKAIQKEGLRGDQIKAGLLKIGNNYQGASGIITFDSKGDVVKPAVVKVVKNGVFEEVK